MESAGESKARLRALREEAAQAATREDEAEPSEPAEESTAREPELKFRNYVVKNEKLEHVAIPAAKAPELEQVVADPEVVATDNPEEILTKLAPKKADWELRRDIAPLLAKLERETQEAIVDLAKEEDEKRRAGTAAF